VCLDSARREWDWFCARGLIGASGLVNDGLDDSCQNTAARRRPTTRAWCWAGSPRCIRSPGTPVTSARAKRSPYCAGLAETSMISTCRAGVRPTASSAATTLAPSGLATGTTATSSACTGRAVRLRRRQPAKLGPGRADRRRAACGQLRQRGLRTRRLSRSGAVTAHRAAVVVSPSDIHPAGRADSSTARSRAANR
jgi:hypothetical protein